MINDGRSNIQHGKETRDTQQDQTCKMKAGQNLKHTLSSTSLDLPPISGQGRNRSSC